MKTILALLFIACVITAHPLDNDEKTKVDILKQEIVHKANKGYSFDIETSDGSKHQETGDFKYVGGLAVKGSYEFVDEEGKVHKVVYQADERGFRPTIID